MPGRIAEMRHAGEDREVAAMVLKRFQIARRLVVLAGFLGEQVWRVQAERPADEEHALRTQGRGLLLGAQAGGKHRIQQRQADADAGGTQERAAVERSKGHDWNLLLGSDQSSTLPTSYRSCQRCCRISPGECLFISKSSSQVDHVVIVHGENLDRCATDGRSADQEDAIPSKMSLPLMSARIEERSTFPRLWIKAYQITRFVKIAVVTRGGQVPSSSNAAVFPWYDMFDVQWHNRRINLW